MRHLTAVLIIFGALVAFGVLTSGTSVPPGWERAWPQTDFSRHVVALDEIQSGGPPKDGIPPIDAPKFEPADQLTVALSPTEPVMSVDVDGDARAYPLSILIWHEVVNDTIGNVPIAVTYCPLCNSGVVFRRIVAGDETSFGTTGMLRNSDLIMYDRATESWWQQFEGRAIVGARAGTRLEKLPIRLEAFREFRERHPRGLVLVPTEASLKAYGRNPYVRYDTAAMPFHYQGEYDGPGSPMMRVVAIDGYDEAWSLDFLREVGTVMRGDIMISWRPGQVSALDAPRISESRDVGTVTAQRHLPDGRVENVIFSVPFAFAFNAFNPDAPIRHAE